MSNKLIGAAAVIMDDAGRILLVKHSYGKLNWELPGGLSEKNESAQETAKREVFEETGFNVTVGRLTGVYYDPTNDMHHFVFICTGTDDQIAKPSSTEILECKYCTPNDLPRPISDFTVQRIHEALDHDIQHVFHNIGPRQWMD